jgi:polysaccharide biosynthesis protein PslH
MPGRALFLTHTAPLPLVSGERIRSFHLLRELARRDWEVSLFSLLHSVPLSREDERALRELCAEVILIPFRASPLAGYLRLARTTLSATAFHERFFFSSKGARRLKDRLAHDGFDVVVAVTLYMYPYVPPAWRGKTVLDTLNVEARRIDAMARVLPRRPRGLVARGQLPLVRRYEAQAISSVERVVVVSDEERSAFEPLAPGKVDLIPNGVDCAQIRPRQELPSRPSLLFVGSMDYGANVDAVEHLIDDVLPLMARRDASLALVGSNPGPSLRRAAVRSRLEVDVAGFVSSTAPYFERNRLFVVPLRFGGGTRLKILEALARGVPVVTTRVGCEGLRFSHGQELIVADDPADFAAWVDRLLEDDDLCLALARAGRAAVEEHYDWPQIGAAFADVLEAAKRGS